MTYKLFLDDLREPPDDTWVVVRSVNEAKEYVWLHDVPTIMSLDHDLGTDQDAPVFLHWLIDYHLDGVFNILQIEMKVHSANPVGISNLNGLWESFKKSQK